MFTYLFVWILSSAFVGYFMGSRNAKIPLFSLVAILWNGAMLLGWLAITAG